MTTRCIACDDLCERKTEMGLDLCDACERRASRPPKLTVADVHEAIAKSAPGADALNEQLRNWQLDGKLR